MMAEKGGSLPPTTVLRTRKMVRRPEGGGAEATPNLIMGRGMSVIPVRMLKAGKAGDAPGLIGECLLG